jgi:hypothetical protein
MLQCLHALPYMQPVGVRDILWFMAAKGGHKPQDIVGTGALSDRLLGSHVDAVNAAQVVQVATMLVSAAMLVW